MKRFSEFLDELYEDMYDKHLSHGFVPRHHFESLKGDKKAMHVHHMSQKYGGEKVKSEYGLSDKEHAKLYSHADHIMHQNISMHKAVGEEVVPFSKENEHFHHAVILKHNKTGETKTVTVKTANSEDHASKIAARQHPDHSVHKVVQYNAEPYEAVEDEQLEPLEESQKRRQRKMVIRFRGGKRQRKLQCPQGMRAHGNTCVRQSAQERQHRRQGSRKRIRTLRGKGAGARRRANFKRQRSLKRRHSAGL